MAQAASDLHRHTRRLSRRRGRGAGQAETIAASIEFMFSLSVPVISVVTRGRRQRRGACDRRGQQDPHDGERDLFGHLARRLRRDPLERRLQGPACGGRAQADRPGLIFTRVIDEIIPEPFGGAHRDWEATFQTAAVVIERHLRSARDPRRSQETTLHQIQEHGDIEKGNGNYWGSHRPS